MNLSEKKAREALRPWWDVMARHCVVAALALSVVLFFSVTRSEREIVVEEEEGGLGGSQDAREDDYFGDLAVPDVGEAQQQQEGVNSGSSNNNSNNNSSDVTDSLLRIKQDLLAELTGRVGVKRTTTISSRSAYSPEFVLLALSMAGLLLLADLAFCRMFYAHHLVQVVCHVLETMEEEVAAHAADGANAKRRRNRSLLSCALHHSNDRRSLPVVLNAFNWLRLAVSVAFLAIAAAAVAGIKEEAQQDGRQAAQHVLGLLLSAVLSLLCCLSCYAATWPWLSSRMLWGRLMTAYAGAVERVDVARGRCVPSPPYAGGGKARVLEDLNPYAASANLRLALDLVALRCGVGLALALLARVEPDVDRNWRPARLSVTTDGEGKPSSSSNNSQLMAVTWRDPLAVLYLAPVPKELRLHYVLEVTFPSNSGLDDLVEVVSHDDARYYRQMWRSSEPGSVSMSLGEPPATYRQVFSGYFSDDNLQQQVSVSAWTLVDGHLIARSTVLYGSDCCCSAVGFRESPSPPAKPPRQCSDREEETEEQRCDVEIVVQSPSDEEDNDDEDQDYEGQDVERGHIANRKVRRRTSVPKERAITPAVSSVFEFSQDDDDEDDEEDYCNNDKKKSDGGSLNGSDRGARSDYHISSGDRSKSLGNLDGKRKRRRRVKKRLPNKTKDESNDNNHAGRDNAAFQDDEDDVHDKVYLI